MTKLLSIIACCGLLVGCAGNQPQTAADLNAAFSVAAAAEAAYSANPHADPRVVAEWSRLLQASQAALQTWTASPSPTAQTAVSSAIAALLAYEANVKAG